MSESENIEGFPFMGSAEHETPRNVVCRECIVSPVDLPLFAPVPWDRVCHGAKDVLRDAAVAVLGLDQAKPRGLAVLLYGAAGTGKTVRARALAAELVAGRIDVGARRVTVLSVACSTLCTASCADSAAEIIAALFDVARCLSPAFVVAEDVDALKGDLAQHFCDGIKTLTPESRVFVVATTRCPWDVARVLLDGPFADARARQLCVFPGVAERAQFLAALPELRTAGTDARSLAADEHTRGYTYADLLALERNATAAAAHRLLVGMGTHPAAAADGVVEIDLSEPHVEATDVTRALETTHASCSPDEQLRYTIWKP